MVRSLRLSGLSDIPSRSLDSVVGIFDDTHKECCVIWGLSMIDQPKVMTIMKSVMKSPPQTCPQDPLRISSLPEDIIFLSSVISDHRFWSSCIKTVYCNIKSV